MGKHQPTIRLVKVEIGYAISLVIGRFEIGSCDPAFGWTVLVELVQFADHAVDAQSGIEHVVNEQQFVVGGEVAFQVFKAMHLDRGALTNTGIRGRANGKVVAVDAYEIHDFLHGYTDWCTTTPDAYDEIRPKAAVNDPKCEFDGVFKKPVGSDVLLVHVVFWLVRSFPV